MEWALITKELSVLLLLTGDILKLQPHLYDGIANSGGTLGYTM